MGKITENTDTNSDQPKPWLFQPGQSGNPLGKPAGTKHKATQAALALLDGEVETLTRKAVELALSGDIGALRLCLDRIVPVYKPSARPVQIDAPVPDDLTGTAKTFVDAAARGDIPPDIAAQLVSAVASVARIEELESLKFRLESLERIMKGKKT